MSEILSDEEQKLKARKKEQETKRNRIEEDFRLTFCETDHGHRVLNYLLETTGVFTRDFKGNSRDIYQAGRRDVGLMIFHFCSFRGLEGLMKIITKNKELKS